MCAASIRTTNDSSHLFKYNSIAMRKQRFVRRWGVFGDKTANVAFAAKA